MTALDQHVLPPKPDRKFKDYIKYPFLKIRSYFIRINQVCGWKFIAFLFVSQMVIKGMMYRIIETIMLPVFKSLGVGVAELQIFTAISTSPWTFKPVFGVLSDLISIRGYHKKYWLLQAVIVGIIAGFLAFPALNNAIFLVLCLIGLNYEMSVIDLLTEAKTAEYMHDNPKIGSDLVTFMNGLQTVGSIISMIFIGHLSDLKLFWVLFLIAIILAAIPFFPVILEWLPEARENIQCIKIDKELFKKHKATFIVIIFTGCSGFILGFFMTFTNKKIISLICAIILLVASVVGSFLAFPQIVAKIGLYQVLVRLSKPSMSTPLDFFFTATPECLASGPHFSFKYYISFTGFSSACMAFVAVWIYQLWLSKWRFRTVLIFTTILVGFAGIFDLLIVLRVNQKMGISDHTFYFFGESIFETTLDMLFWLPSSIIISKVCPKGLESATYAYLAGISNYSLMVSELVGVIIYESAGITKCDFKSLWWLILCFHIILPIVGGIPAAFLVPNDQQDDDIMIDVVNADEEIELDEQPHMLVKEVVVIDSYSAGDPSLDFEFEFGMIDSITKTIENGRCGNNIGMIKRAMKTRDHSILKVLGLRETLMIKYITVPLVNITYQGDSDE